MGNILDSNTLTMTPGERNKASVLVVEPDANDRNNLRTSLKNLGYGTVSDAPTHFAGLEKMEEHDHIHTEIHHKDIIIIIIIIIVEIQAIEIIIIVNIIIITMEIMIDIIIITMDQIIIMVQIIMVLLIHIVNIDQIKQRYI